MLKNKSLIVSIFVTVFLVVVAGGIATSVLANNQPGNAAKVNAADAVKTYQAREAEYQALLAKANSQLELANQQLTQLANSTSTSDSSSQSASDLNSSYPVTKEMAMSIAFQTAGDYPLSEPELVDYNGTVAYEVKFQNGNIYVDATTGQILFNGISAPAAQTITADQAAKIAVAYLGNSAITDIEVGSYSGSRVYEIKFANGQEVYVSLAGKIVAVQMPPSTSSTSSHETEDDEHTAETPEVDD